MLGAIIGDIVGSRFEFSENKSKDFDFFTDECCFTDDSVMTLAVGLAIVKSNKDLKILSETAIEMMQMVGNEYPEAGYGAMFCDWLMSKNPKPYNSFGNGAVMRVSDCGFMGNSLEEVKELSNAVTKVTHNHPEGLKGAEATAVAIYLAKVGKSKEEIRKYITDNYYRLDFTIDEIRPIYEFDVTCQGSVPQALQAFFEGNSFEECIRLAISLGGDTDTQGAIVGGIAEAFYGIPKNLKEKAYNFLDKTQKNILDICYGYIEANKNIG